MLEATRLPWPVDWSSIFGRVAPLFVELGFGNADFLVQLAHNHPESNVLGLDISLPSLRKGERKVERMGLPHARVLRAEAQQALWTLCQPGAIARIYINFPDPWQKDSQKRRRLISDRFLHLAGSRLVTGGQLRIATDHSEYAHWIAECLTNSSLFESVSSEAFIAHGDSLLGTKYELRALSEGRECYHFSWRRNIVAAPDHFPVPQEYAMPHVVISTPPDLLDISQHFAPRHWSSGGTVVRLVDLYGSFRHDTLVIDVYVAEEPLDQRMLIALTRRSAGDLLIHLHEIGFPRPTSGVHFAIDQVAKWVCSLSPGAKIERHNLQRVREQS
jgi:tRNA (guanine-N7-)-methyltransferase